MSARAGHRLDRVAAPEVAAECCVDGGPAAGRDRRDVLRRGRRGRRHSGDAGRGAAAWTPVSTSRPNPDEMLEVYERLAADGCDRDRLDPPLRRAVAAPTSRPSWRRRRSPVPVHPVDSRQVGMGTGFAVLRRPRLATPAPTQPTMAAAAQGARRGDHVAVLRRHPGVPAPRRPGRRGRRAARVGAGGQADPQGRGRPGRAVRAGAHLRQGAGPARGAGGRGCRRRRGRRRGRAPGQPGARRQCSPRS